MADKPALCPKCGGKGYWLNDCLGLTHPEYEDCPHCTKQGADHAMRLGPVRLRPDALL